MVDSDIPVDVLNPGLWGCRTKSKNIGVDPYVWVHYNVPRSLQRLSWREIPRTVSKPRVRRETSQPRPCVNATWAWKR